jgi:DNA-binding transcriptional regulator YhcF (GntR family)
MIKFNCNPNIKKYKFEQFRDEIIRNIDNGELQRGALIPSVVELTEKHGLSRLTIERAYMCLKEKGYIIYVAGKGYYVAEKQSNKKNVLLVFNKLSDFKKNIYYGFLKGFGEYGRVDLQIHHYDIKLLKEILSDNLAKYDYFVVMPHFKYATSNNEILKILSIIPPFKLLLLDKQLLDLGYKYNGVYQDFKLDTYEALNSISNLFSKYKELILVFPSEDYHPLEIVNGVKIFCREQVKLFKIVSNIGNEVLEAGSSFVIIDETELAKLIKKIRNTNLILGRDIGIVSFNETVFKELLDITVFSTDFFNMGFQAGQMIVEDGFKTVRNPFTIIKRKSL